MKNQKKKPKTKKIKSTALSTLIMISLAATTITALEGVLITNATPTSTITLTPNSQAPGASVMVAGTNFGATKAAGIGFGGEVAVAGEVVNQTGSGLGPYTRTLAYRPIKPGTAKFTVDVGGGLVTYIATDLGNGTFTSTSQYFANGTINYVTGQYVGYSTSEPTGYTVVVTADYTHYQYGVTPAAGITTSSSGAFSASITVPSVGNGNYNVTAIDASGNLATSSLAVGGSSLMWSKTYGGAGNDIGTGDTVQTSDGGYAVSGDTSSQGAGGTDFWLFRTDALGNMLWNKTYGGPLNEVCGDMSQTSDGGYVLSGNTASFGAAGGMDVYLVRVDASGNMLWNKTYGGSGSEYALTVIQTADSGFAMIGYTNSFGAGNNDIYVIKTDTAGNMQWNKTYGGPNADMGYGLVQTSDGAYIFSGYTSSFGAGLQDFWLFRVDASGNMLWNKTYGGTGSDYGYGVVQTSDGGYAMTGRTTSFGGDNAYLVRTDASGNMLWNKTYGEPNLTQFGFGLHLIQTTDGGFAIVGTTYANGQDILLIKTDTAGNLQWNMTYGGTGVENGYDILQSNDGGYLLTGNTNSFGAGGNDVWLVKTNGVGVVPEFSSWVIPALAAAATGFFIMKKKKLFSTS